MKVYKEFKIDYAHRLFHHGGQCNNIHGHTAKIVVEVEGPVNTTSGMVVDFNDLKTLCNLSLVKYDHALILNSVDVDLIKCLKSCPGVNHNRIIVLPFEPTAENLSRQVYNELKEFRGKRSNPNPQNDWVISAVTFYETEDNYATHR